MSDANINHMDFKQLRNEVQLLRDELAIFKRNYEDMIYNLDSDNFSGSYTAAQEGMKAQVKIAADSVSSKVSRIDLDTALENYSKIEQTADAIRATVSAEANLKGAELLKDVENFYDLSDEDIEKLDKGKIYKTQQKNENGKVTGEKYYYFNSLSQTWELISGDSIYTVFQQTDEGFVMRGNTVIDGSTTITRNLVLQGSITWDTDDTPVQARYSSDGVSWHPIQTSDDVYLQLSFDGGNSWSDTMHIGNNSSGGAGGVTVDDVFEALTNAGEDQGIYAAYYNGKNRVFINAEYIRGDVINADTVRVSHDLWIGGGDYKGIRTIHFGGGANIGSTGDHLGDIAPTGIQLTGSSLHIAVDDLSTEKNSPQILVNAKKLATQDWVLDNVGTTTYVAVFGE